MRRTARFCSRCLRPGLLTYCSDIPWPSSSPSLWVRSSVSSFCLGMLSTCHTGLHSTPKRLTTLWCASNVSQDAVKEPPSQANLPGSLGFAVHSRATLHGKMARRFNKVFAGQRLLLCVSLLSFHDESQARWRIMDGEAKPLSAPLATWQPLKGRLQGYGDGGGFMKLAQAGSTPHVPTQTLALQRHLPSSVSTCPKLS